MVLNSECVRDVLLAVESCDFGECITLETLQEKLPSYSQDELWYTCLKLKEGGLLDLLTFRSLGMRMPGIARINDLSFAGHEFLNNVRSDTNWENVKKTAKKAGVFSLSMLGEIASAVASAAVTAALQPHP